MIDLLFAASKLVGYLAALCASIIGIRLLFYFRSFFLHWPRYRQLRQVTAQDIQTLPRIPFVKIQITTKGLPDSTRVIRRGIENVLALAREAPNLYWEKLSIEVVTEAPEQEQLLLSEFAHPAFPLHASVVLVPAIYETPAKTRLKARSLHYMVELRRRGFNRKAGPTFLVHYDEESVMEPDELRKLIHYLANSPAQLSEGPIYYPLDYSDANMLCRAMEANRPIGCFECREVMESGTPLHLHGSNLVVDEELENALGWDIGTLDKQPLVAEDYVFGVRAYLRYGSPIFGWHGCIMLEQPPFSLGSAFKQRSRWITGVLQGQALMQRMPEFRLLPRRTRWRLTWATRYRILTFTLGLPAGAVSLVYLLYQMALLLAGQAFLPLPLPIMIWLLFVGFLWLNSLLIGAWYNLAYAQGLSAQRRWTESMRVLTLAPLAGVIESSAGFWATLRWLAGKREASWQPTPKIIQHTETARRRNMGHGKERLIETRRLLQYTTGALATLALYLIAPLMFMLSLVFPSVWSRLLVACEIVALGELLIVIILVKTTPQASKRVPQRILHRVRPRLTHSFVRPGQIAVRSSSTILLLGIALQWLLLSTSSPWTLTNSSAACHPQGNISEAPGPSTASTPSAGFQTGVIFPRWGTGAYTAQDQGWQAGLQQIKQQTAAQWLGLSINLFQSSLVSTQVHTDPSTPTPDDIVEGIRAAHAKGYHVFVFPQLTVKGVRSWAGNIAFPTQKLAQQWFDSYWHAFQPYVAAAQQAGAEELAIGTEYELLQPAAPALWNQLIARVRTTFSGTLTYDLNWSSLYYPLPSWLYNPSLDALGISLYMPLTNQPERLNPQTLPALWQTTIGRQLDAFATQINKPVLLSELGYRDSSDALYNPWETSTNAPVDQVEQAAAYNAALWSIMSDPHITGVFAWAWEFPPFDMRCRLAAQVLHRWYTATASATSADTTNHLTSSNMLFARS
jgi:hypothetical protein